MVDEFTRAWNEWLATVAEPLWGGIPTLGLLTFGAALLVGLLWAYWPAWLPSRWSRSRRRGRAERKRRARLGRPRLRLRWRLRWRRRRRGRPDEESERLPDDEVPDLPAEVLSLSADELAAAGRYAEAVRERLRAILRGLIERGLLPSSPGWTVLELARAGGRARPQLADPLDAAAGVFSEIWYGLRPATAEDDAAMRAHAAAVSLAVADLQPDKAAAGRPA
jgi:Domain of unknown function (DUF4129)